MLVSCSLASRREPFADRISVFDERSESGISGRERGESRQRECVVGDLSSTSAKLLPEQKIDGYQSLLGEDAKLNCFFVSFVS